jgi:type II secretory pathway predicted ATPase ExeA
MYEKFYGLREKPFSLVPDPDYLFLGRLHGAALNMLEYCLRGQASFTLITGEVGCGKTILIRRFLRMVDDASTVGMVTNTPRDKSHVLERILMAFNLDYRGKSEIEQYETLTDFMEEEQRRGRRTVLIIDEAHNLDEDSLEELRMLSNINVDKLLALQIVLVGQPEILELLNARSLRQLTQRISVNFRLLPLNFPETRRYIRHRLRVAGGSPDIFEPRAIAVIHLLSGGVPRLINVLCDTALVYGFGEDRGSLDAQLIQAVASDMLVGGLSTLPAVDHNLEEDNLLETAEKLVASLDPDELEDEYVELPLPPAPHHDDSKDDA